MICSARELGIGDDHAGIIVLPPEHAARRRRRRAARACVDEVLDIAVTPDRGYCLSMRGVAREAATAYGVPFRDPAAARRARGPNGATATRPAIADPTGCDRFVAARRCTGFDPDGRARRSGCGAGCPTAGMRPISLAVDVTNYVMLELGQPLHAFDRRQADRRRSASAGPSRARS